MQTLLNETCRVVELITAVLRNSHLTGIYDSIVLADSLANAWAMHILTVKHLEMGA